MNGKRNSLEEIEAQQGEEKGPRSAGKDDEQKCEESAEDSVAEVEEAEGCAARENGKEQAADDAGDKRACAARHADGVW